MSTKKPKCALLCDATVLNLSFERSGESTAADYPDHRAGVMDLDYVLAHCNKNTADLIEDADLVFVDGVCVKNAEGFIQGGRPYFEPL